MAPPDRPPAALLPNAERVEIAAASHPMHEENAGAATEAILCFLAGHASRTSR
jgi:hypothetical protein